MPSGRSPEGSRAAPRCGAPPHSRLCPRRWELDKGKKAVLFHFGMTGSFVVRGQGATKYKSFSVDSEQWPPRFHKLTMKLSTGAEVAFVDSRRFARIRCAPPRGFCSTPSPPPPPAVAAACRGRFTCRRPPLSAPRAAWPRTPCPSRPFATSARTPSSPLPPPSSGPTPWCAAGKAPASSRLRQGPYPPFSLNLACCRRYASQLAAESAARDPANPFGNAPAPRGSARAPSRAFSSTSPSPAALCARAARRSPPAHAPLPARPSAARW